MKSITIIRRRDDLSRDAFRQYYETHHAPLGVAWFAFDRYVRNHVAAGAPDPGFDCVAEFWPSDPDQIARALAEAGSLFADDDARFMSPERSGGVVVEHHLAGSPRSVDAAGTSKRIDLLRASTLPDLARLRRWAEDEVSAGRAERVTIDLPAADLGDLGDVALLHRWGGDADAVPPGERLATARIDVHETPADVLARGREIAPGRG